MQEKKGLFSVSEKNESEGVALSSVPEQKQRREGKSLSEDLTKETETEGSDLFVGLDFLLSDAEEVLKTHSLSEEQIDEMIEKRQEALDRLRRIDFLQERALKKLREYDDYSDLTLNDQERLEKEGVIDENLSAKLKKIDELIDGFEGKEYLTVVAQEKLNELYRVRELINKKIEIDIKKKQEETAEKIEKIKDKLLKNYQERVERLEGIIAEFESNPFLMKKLESIAREEMKVFFAKREEDARKAREAEEKIKNELLPEAERFIQSLEDRNLRSFERLAKLFGEDFVGDIFRFVEIEDRSKRSMMFNMARKSLKKVILEGQGEKQIKSLSEIVPWEVKSKIRYGAAFNFLQRGDLKDLLQKMESEGDERAKGMLARIEGIIQGNEILRNLIGPRKFFDKKTKEKKDGYLWEAFEERKNIDKKKSVSAKTEGEGGTEVGKKEDPKLKELIDGLINFGGSLVRVPIVKRVNGVSKTVGFTEGAVIIERRLSKRSGRYYFYVVEAVGTEQAGLKEKMSSPEDGSGFPWWMTHYNYSVLMNAKKQNDAE